MNYLLDTDILIWILRGDKRILEFVKKKIGPKVNFCSSISVAEVFKHVLPVEEEMTEKFLRQHKIVNIDYEIAKLAGSFFAKYSQGKTKIYLLDCLIAASAKATSCALISCNSRHYPMKDIKVITP